MREKQIERKLVEAVKSAGGICPKLVSPGMDGMPDRMVLLGGCRIGFVEDYGYIVQVPQKYSGCGRPPQPKYVVNPLAENMICPSVTPMSPEACKKSGA